MFVHILFRIIFLYSIFCYCYDNYNPTNQLFVSNINSNDLMPSIGNGYVSCFINSNNIFISGLFNGFLNIAPSHRAIIPSPINYQLSLIDISDKYLQSDGYLLDIEKAIFSKYYSVKLLSNNDTLTQITQNWYAHRIYRSLIVHEIIIDNSMNNNNISFTISNGISSFNSPDIDFTLIENDNYLLYNGSIIQSESINSTKVIVSVCTTNINSPYSSISISNNTIKSFFYLTTFQTNIPGDSNSPSNTAKTLWQDYNSDSSNLKDSHINEWNKIWNSCGIEIEGSDDILRLQQVTNTSLYWILSSVRIDWPWSLSPGSLASNGYNGHTFWDTETWMYPTIMMLNNEIGNSLLQYRINHLHGALRKAKTYFPPYSGAMFPWEDAYTGYEVCPQGVATCRYEQHITGDISFAFRQYWDNSHNITWLNDISPLAYDICTFWESRVEKNNSLYVINDVIPPDEYHIGVNNSVYTNVVAKMSFQFCEIISNKLNTNFPINWQNIMENIKIPFDYSRDIHLEYDGYTNEEIKQADVILLGFPLLYNMSKIVRANDLNFYSNLTDPNGPAMTWSMTAIGYIELQQYDIANNYFIQGFANAQEPFQVWTETPTGGTVNFITGCGGFLQSMLFGYPNMRLHLDYISFNNPVLPRNSTGIKLRNIDYLQNEIDIYYNKSNIIFELKYQSSIPLFISIIDNDNPYLQSTLYQLLSKSIQTYQLELQIPISISKSNMIILYKDIKE